MKDIRIPNKEEIKNMMNEVHNIWLKKHWEADTDEEFQQMTREAQTIREQYPFHLTEVMLYELDEIIDARMRERRKSYEGI